VKSIDKSLTPWSSSGVGWFVLAAATRAPTPIKEKRIKNIYSEVKVSCCENGSDVSALLLGIVVPNNIVGKTDDFITGALCHLSKALGFGLILEGITREIDA
jgi:hypothetical protein